MPDLNTILVTLVGIAVLAGVPLLNNFALKSKLKLTEHNIQLAEKISDLEKEKLAKMVAQKTSTEIKTTIDPLAAEVASVRKDNEMILKQVAALIRDKEVRDEYIDALQANDVVIKDENIVLKTGHKDINAAIITIVAARDGEAEEFLVGIRAAIAQMRSNLTPETRKEVSK